MAKGKARSRRRLVSAERIAQAKHAKGTGLLSKRAKIGNSRLSPAVARKLAILESVRAVPTFELRPGAKHPTQLSKAIRKPVKVSRELAANLKANNFLTFGRQVIIPANDKRFAQAISSGEMAGIQFTGKRPRPDSEFIETTDLLEIIDLHSQGIDNYKDLFKALYGHNGRRFDQLNKTPDDLYSFTLNGFHPRPDFQKGELREYLTASELRQYLGRYKWTDAKYDVFRLVKLQRGEQIGRTPDEVYKAYYAANPSAKRDKRGDRLSRSEYLKRKGHQMQKATAEELLERKRASTRKAQANFRNKLKDKLGLDEYRRHEAAERQRRKLAAKARK